MTQDTILIVDDEPAIRDMIRMAMERADFHCLEAGDIHQAHCLIVDNNPNLVLLDWMLPDASGIEFLRRLRNTERTRALPVIMLTARSEESDRVCGLNVGADDYLGKPFSLRELAASSRARPERHRRCRDPGPRLSLPDDPGIRLSSGTRANPWHRRRRRRQTTSTRGRRCIFHGP